jgi:hypothetical protein
MDATRLYLAWASEFSSINYLILRKKQLHINYKHSSDSLQLLVHPLHLRLHVPPEPRISLAPRHYILLPQHLQISSQKAHLLAYHLHQGILQLRRNAPESLSTATPMFVPERFGPESLCNKMLATPIAALS